MKRSPSAHYTILLFSTTFISIIICILQASACVIDDGKIHPENSYRRAESTVWNDGIKHPDNDSRRSSDTKEGEIEHERTKLSENSNKKHDDFGSRRFDGMILRNDGYFAGKPQGGNAVGEIDATESYAELFKSLTTVEHDKYSSAQTQRVHVKRTTPYRISLEEDCYYLAYYCLKAYKTGPVCGRTMYYNYQDFKNYCMLDFVNCMEKYEVWQIVHMGQCTAVSRSPNYQIYDYDKEDFLDRVFVLQD